MLKLLGGLAIIGLGPTELIIILLIIFLIFGATQLPKLSRALGESMHELRRGLKTPEENEEEKDKAEDSAKKAAKKKDETEKEG